MQVFNVANRLFMKLLLIMLLCTTIFWACDNNAEAKKEDTSHAIEGTHHEAVEGKHNEAVEETHREEEDTSLSLNNGVKWKSDKSTNKNVAELQQVIQNFSSNKNISFTDYAAVAQELRSGLNKMINECRMKGAEHDALHLWLYPLLKNVKNLKEAKGVETSEKEFDKVAQQVKIYSNYFE